LPEVHAFFQPNKVFSVRGQMLSTKTVPPLFKGCMTANHGYEYWRQTPDGRVVLGGFRWRSNDYELGVADESTTPDVQVAAEEFLHDRFPDHDWQVEYRWGGVMGFSADGLPFIGPLPGHSDLMVAGGFTGYGMGFGTLAGEAAADLALYGRTDTDIELFNPSRFLR
jgi:glycine/D-amino acid oxidase-like deaminating enzyme